MPLSMFILKKHIDSLRLLF